MKKLRSVLYLFLTLILFCCKNEEKKESTNSEIKSEKKQVIQSSKEDILDTYVPVIQNNILLEPGDSYSSKHLLKDSENNFDLTDNNIRVVIPNSRSKMKILDVFNISNYNTTPNLNAIVIHISDSTSDITNDTVTHKLIADIKISKINGLSTDHLRDGKLKVFIINEDILDNKEKAAFAICAKQEIQYSHLECNLDNGQLYEKDVQVPFKPREQEGDIITGG